MTDLTEVKKLLYNCSGEQLQEVLNFVNEALTHIEMIQSMVNLVDYKSLSSSDMQEALKRMIDQIK